jgi:hypothetical protein
VHTHKGGRKHKDYKDLKTSICKHIKGVEWRWTVEGAGEGDLKPVLGSFFRGDGGC